MALETINLNEKIASKNLGVILDNGNVKMCFIDKTGESAVAVSLSDMQSVDFSKVIPINDMFYKKDQPDNGPHGDMLAYIAQNEKCPIFEALKSDKSIVHLRNLSVLELDIHWYNEDNGVQTVNVDNSKSFKIKDILKAESKINIIEQRLREKEEAVSGMEM